MGTWYTVELNIVIYKNLKLIIEKLLLQQHYMLLFHFSVLLFCDTI